MPHFIKTGYWDLKAKAPKEWLDLERLIANNSAGGGVVSLTKSQVDALIASNGLVPGQSYAISGVDVPLYGGTTIILQAETTNTLSISGHGIFYNPKYDQSCPFNGYGIWDNYMNVVMSNFSGEFNKGDLVIANNGAQGTYIVNTVIQYISGDWTTATSLTNDNTGGTADVQLNDYKINSFTVTSGTFQLGEYCNTDTGQYLQYYGDGVNNLLIGALPSVPDMIASTSITGQISGATADISISLKQPSYTAGQYVIWGGKKWINKVGNLGASLNRYELNSEWQVIDYNDVDYDVVADEIMYDYQHDMIVSRKDKWDNEVKGNYQIFIQLNDYTYDDGANPIKDFQWGNGSGWYRWNPNLNQYDSDSSSYTGVVGNKIYDSYMDCLNFVGSMIWYNSLSQRSRWYNNIINRSRSSNYFRFNNITSDTVIADNAFCTYSTLYENRLSGSSGISNNYGARLRIYNNDLINSGIYNNVGDGDISSNHLIESDFSYNTGILGSGDFYIKRNYLNDSYIRSNTLFNSVCYVTDNSLRNNSHINYNNIGDGCSISGNTLVNYGEIDNNALNNGSRIENNQVTNNSQLSYNEIDYSSTISSNTINNVIDDYGVNRIYSNTLIGNSHIDGNLLNSDNMIQGNTLQYNSNIINNIFNNGGQIDDNTLTNTSYIHNNEVKNNSSINQNNLDGSFINFNRLNQSWLNFSPTGTITSKYIQFIDANYAINTYNLSSATVIFGQYSKQMFRNSAGNVRLGYYNNASVFTVVDVNA